MLKSDVNRREFLQLSAGAGAGLAMPIVAFPTQCKTMIGIQVGAVSFVDEGTSTRATTSPVRTHSPLPSAIRADPSIGEQRIRVSVKNT